MQIWVQNPEPFDPGSGARNYRHSFRENKTKTLFFLFLFWACFHENAGLKIRALDEKIRIRDVYPGSATLDTWV